MPSVELQLELPAYLFWLSRSVLKTNGISNTPSQVWTSILVICQEEIIMSHKSPSKVLWNVKRITRFLAKKAAEKKPLTLKKLPVLDIPPRINILTLCQKTILSILPSPPRVLSFSKPVLIDIPQETLKQFIPYPPDTKRNYPSNPLTQLSLYHWATNHSKHSSPVCPCLG